ncbi:MAG: YgiT-type zinc finger protein [Thermodesulfobacteriota bacterium]
MKCAACEQEMVERTTELDLRVKNKLYLVNNVRLVECQNCGEKVIAPAISEEIFNMIKSHKYKLKTMDLPVVELSVT